MLGRLRERMQVSSSEHIGIARVLRIYALLIGSFAVLQFFFAIFAFNPLQFIEKVVCFAIGGTFLGLALGLYATSFLVKMREYRFLEQHFRRYVPHNFGKIVLTEFARETHIPREIAEEYFDLRAQKQHCAIKSLYGGEKIYIFFEYSPN